MEGQSNPAAVTDSTPEFSAIFEDPYIGDYATSFQIQVSASSTDWATSSLLWNSAKQNLSATTSDGERIEEISYAGQQLQYDGSTKYWRIKFWDSFDLEGDWSSPGSFSMATTTSASFISDALGDGVISRTSVDWDNAHDATSGSGVSTGPASTAINPRASVDSGGEYVITRGFLPFKTFLLPDNAIIASSTLYVYSNGRFLCENDDYSYLQPVGPATPASSTDLYVSDYDQAGSVDGPILWSDTKNTYSDSWGNNSLVAFPLNGNGVDGISNTDYTNIAMRLGHDIEDVAPDVTSCGNPHSWSFYSADFFDPDRRPRLDVEYVVPG